jgi:hypothetical protein
VRDLAVLFLHLLATVAQFAGPGGARSVVAESVLVKHQLLILNRSRKRSPNLRFADRVVAGLCLWSAIIHPDQNADHSGHRLRLPTSMQDTEQSLNNSLPNTR